MSLNALSAVSGLKIANNNAVEQNVTIYADFPGVTVESEIQNAFNNMELQASQFAFKTN